MFPKRNKMRKNIIFLLTFRNNRFNIKLFPNGSEKKRGEKMGELKLDLNRLKAERIAKGWDQAEFAHKLVMSRTSYSKRENGLVNISIKELARMMSLLGFSKDKISIFFTQNVPNREQKGRDK